ncbi:hypothetical protein JFV29_13905 [Peribacillus sp. TH16]|uniref:hypothetical protein n=1 Tax=Peribacillus sp. TH16 TaxID=2798482 RepID=UPI0019123D59|nr:hypothetical protein [Peribacillus sp. TH16]MBK5482948.1 hypothetical protein [Peribacillus sp. TH16]MBK5482966.1 hypothetical protein [Peribacillus sp. TH16]
MDEPSVSDQVGKALDGFYQNYIIDTVNGSFQVFQSFTYGEMVISFLLAAIFLLLLLKWVFEVVR